MRNIKLRLFGIIFISLSYLGVYSQSTTTTGVGAGTLGGSNSFFGYYAGNKTTSYGNTFIGCFSGRMNTTGSYNTFMGRYSGYNNSSGRSNVFLGGLSGNYNLTGNDNVFIGLLSGYRNSTASGNTFIGRNSGSSNTTGASNVFIGHNSGYRNNSGRDNIMLGSYAGYNNTYGSDNSFIGKQSGYSNATGRNNVFMGRSAGYRNVSGSNNVFIGYSSGYYELGSNRLYIDNSTTTSPLIYGKFDTNQLGVNTTKIPTGFAFAVKGKIITEELKVQTFSSWPDYVFEKEYVLPTLKAVEQHIAENGHLKNIPSAKEVAKEGLFLGEMNAKLLRKIEELTLYTIQQEKNIQQLTEKSDKLEGKMNEITSAIQLLKNKK